MLKKLNNKGLMSGFDFNIKKLNLKNNLKNLRIVNLPLKFALANKCVSIDSKSITIKFLKNSQ